MIKRLIDIVGSLVGLIVFSPVLLPTIFLVWWQDKHSPFYMAPRVAQAGGKFTMLKLRSMSVNADKTGVSSTSNTDRRITPIGHFIRRFKLDEITQLWNVLRGEMSLVGPRPQVKSCVDLYTRQEMRLLDVRPGITDLSSIVFADEGDILQGSQDPDLLYEQIIRPWKSRLGLLYVEKRTVLLDIKLIILTVAALISRPYALRGVEKILIGLSADSRLIQVSRRDSPLKPFPPPGADSIVQSLSSPMVAVG